MQVPSRSVGIVLTQMTLELNPFDVSLAILSIQLVTSTDVGLFNLQVAAIVNVPKTSL